MDNKEEITDVLLMTKRFRSPTEFCLYIDEMVLNYKIGYMDAVINYCNEIGIDIENVGYLVNQKLKEKIKMEAEQANLMKPTGQLPV